MKLRRGNENLGQRRKERLTKEQLRTKKPMEG